MTGTAVAYETLADWFEFLNDDCDYQRWSQYFLQGLEALGAGNRGLEIGCGSGAFTRVLTRAGYFVTGTDVSAFMLSKAVKLAREEGLNIPFLQADATTVTVHERVDFVLSANDCYNYIPPAVLPRAFKKAANCLVKNGIFWFDVSSAYKFRTKIANNILADDRDDVTFLSFNTLYGDRVETDVTLFVRQEGGLFRRSDERHIQYIHEEEAISSALGAAGFEIERVEGHLGQEKRESDRLNFICREVR